MDVQTHARYINKKPRPGIAGCGFSITQDAVYTTPWAIMVFATLRNPAIFAPAT